MDWDALNLWLQAATIGVGAFVTIFPPSKRLAKYAILLAIVACGVGGIFATGRASNEADARNAAAQAEIVRLSKEADRRVAQVQERLEDVSGRLAAKGIAVQPADLSRPAMTALDAN